MCVAFFFYRITDFGSSRVLLQETLGQMTKGLGTPQYMSPEVLEGSKGSFKKPSDVYSYSITIYELWAGKNVHEACKLESFFKYVEFILKNNVYSIIIIFMFIILLLFIFMFIYLYLYLL